MKRFKLNVVQDSLVTGHKFFKWTETCTNDKPGTTNPQPITLKIDENGYILYWRDLNKKADYLDIAYIRDVRIGRYANTPKDKNTRDLLLCGQSNLSLEEITMSIYYGYDFVNVQCINLVAMASDADKIIKEWSKCLLDCIINPKVHNLSPWEHLDKFRIILLYGKSVIDERNTKDFVLPVQTIVDLFVTTDRQHIEAEKQHIYHMLQSVGLPSGKNDNLDMNTLTQDKFFEFYLRLVSKEDIEKIFSEYGTRKKLCMTAQQFQIFFNEKQRDPRLNELLHPYYSLDKSAEIISKFESDVIFEKKKQLSPQGLMRYLMDAENEIIDPTKYALNEDMDQPLCHYYINSSHNTYLNGHQITSESQVEMYRQVLLSGCRCIELDCWDDKNLDEPVITHGHTLCTQILFKDAVEAIKECAFKTSPYPVLMSFENHCSKSMQQKMAKYLVDIFGDMLLIEPLPQYPLKPGVKLPSPEDLKYKILIKNKKTDYEKRKRNQTAVRQLDSSGNTESSAQQQEHTSNGVSSITAAVMATTTFAAVTEGMFTQNDNDSSYDLLAASNASRKNSCKKSIKENQKLQEKQLSFDHDDESDQDSECDDDNPNSNSGLTSNGSEKIITAKEMSNLVNYLKPVNFRSFEIAEKRNTSFELSSFLETKAYNLHKEKSIEFVNYNKRQFSRIYPKSTRIASDNFIPQVYWNVGCQLVTLNFQTLDVGMRLNMGKFEYNHRSGYILKPEVLRRVDVNKSFDPFAESPLDGIVAATVNVQVISGIFLDNKHEKRLGHTVLVEMFGLPADSLKGQKSYRVKMSSTNTFNVIYTESVFTFKKIIMPELASISFTALDEQNRFIGYRVLPIIGLRSGYRYICLKNESNQALNMCMLFVNIAVKDYVPNKFAELADALADPIRYISNLEKREEMLKSLSDENEESLKDTSQELDSKDISNSIYKTPSANQIFNSNGTNRTPQSSHSNLNNTANFPINLNPQTQSQSRVSVCVEKLQWSNGTNTNNALNSHMISMNTSSASNLEIKRKSQADIYLGISFLDITRSCSNSTADLGRVDMRKTSLINSSRLNDPNLFAEIDLERLKQNKTYVRLWKSYLKKINRLEKDADKRVLEIGQSLNTECEKMFVEAQKLKQRFEKDLVKGEKQTIEARSEYMTRVQHIDNETVERVRRQYEKRALEMQNIYFEAYRATKSIQNFSLEPLFTRLEKLITTIQQQRMQELRLIADKEIAEVNKQVHQQIKYKKKYASKNAQDKHEFQRLSREIEKDSVSMAVTENTKMRELLKAKEKLLQQVFDKTFILLKEQKTHQKSVFEHEFQKKYEVKKKDIEGEYNIEKFLLLKKII